MCGIFGIVLKDPVEIPDRVVEAVSRRLEKRGPDSLGFFREGGALLGMRRLAIIDPEGASPPFSNESGRFQVVGNGEIYNHADIRNRLVLEGHAFDSRNDLEVLAHLAETDRIDWELGLRGMFAFAAWDREERRLRLARDRFGIKPLFWAGDENGVAFASTLPALKTLLLEIGQTTERTGSTALDSLLRHEGWRLNENALRGYLESLCVSAPDTIYRDVYSLPPASRLQWEPGAERIDEKFWRPSYEPKKQISEREALEQFQATFAESVRYHLVSDVPVGAFLSGGLDSGFLVAEAAAALGKNLSTYTVGFEESAYSEIDTAREVAGAIGTDHREIRIEPMQGADLFKIVDDLNQPFGDSSTWPTWAISRAVGAERKVALAGDGGDELWGGYPYYPLYHLTRRLPKFWDKPPARAFETGWLATIRRGLGDCFRPPSRLYQRWRSLDPEGTFWNGVLLPDFRGAAPGWGVENDPGRSGHERMLRADVEGYLPYDLLEKVDTMSMAHSLEVRVPWLDPVLFETVSRFPSKLKINGALTKWLVRKSIQEGAANGLPKSLLSKKKQGFAIPVHAWMRYELAPLFDAYPLAADSKVSGFFDLRALRRRYETHRAGGLRLGHHLWAVLILEIWLRKNRLSV